MLDINFYIRYNLIGYVPCNLFEICVLNKNFK